MISKFLFFGNSSLNFATGNFFRKRRTSKTFLLQPSVSYKSSSEAVLQLIGCMDLDFVVIPDNLLSPQINLQSAPLEKLLTSVLPYLSCFQPAGLREVCSLTIFCSVMSWLGVFSVFLLWFCARMPPEALIYDFIVNLYPRLTFMTIFLSECFARHVCLEF